MIPVFDGHNDTLTRIRHTKATRPRDFLERSAHGHLDLPRAREAGLAGGFFAVFTRTEGWEMRLDPVTDGRGAAEEGAWSVPLARRITRRAAWDFTTAVVSDLLRLIERAEGAMTLVTSADALESALEAGRFAVVLHVEGAEAIDTRLESLDVRMADALADEAARLSP